MTQLKALIDNWILIAQGLLASVGALAFDYCWFRCTDRKDESVGLAIPAAGRAFSGRCSVRMKPGPGSSVDGKGEKGIDGSLERAGTPLHLGE